MRRIATKGTPTEMTRDHDQNDRNHPQRQQRQMWRNRDHFQPDQQEQHGIEDLVNQGPEFEQIVLRHIAHRMGDTRIADHKARNRHRHRPADMQRHAKAVSAHHHGQRNHHLDIIFIDAAHGAKGDPADDQAEQGPAARFLKEIHRRVGQVEFLAARRDGQKDGENHHAHAVIEQAFPATVA
jgi:hypothetical protein